MEDSSETQVATNAGGGKRLLLLIIAVIIATATAVWLVPDDEGLVPESPPKQPVATGALEPLTQPAATVAPETVPEPLEKPAPDIETAINPGDQARAVIARLRDGGADAGSAAFAEAEQQREAGQTEDAYLLYFFAAKQGSPEAALALGTQADPAYFVPQSGVLDLADPGQAYKWYRMAADNGNREAERRLSALLDWAKESAAAGDEQARRLMLQWRHRE